MRSLLVGGTFDSAKISGSKVREEGEAEERKEEGRRRKEEGRTEKGRRTLTGTLPSHLVIIIIKVLLTRLSLQASKAKQSKASPRQNSFFVVRAQNCK